MRECCGKPKALLQALGDSLPIYPSGGHKPMLWLTILFARANAVPPFFALPGDPTCTHTVAAPRRALAPVARNRQDT
jgi:hypothetical protein